VQERVLQAVETLAGPMPIALFSHADVIRAALANYLHRDLNDLLSISFEPGAVAFVEWGPAHPVRVNLTPLQTVGV
jgi:broad specificity phosphatase PhoE